MPLYEVQKALLQALTDLNIGERVTRDPVGMAWELGITEEEARILAAMKWPDLHLYQRMIQSKWMATAKVPLLITRQVVGPILMEQALSMVQERPMRHNEWADRMPELISRIIASLEQTDVRREYVRCEEVLVRLWQRRRAGSSEEREVRRNGHTAVILGLLDHAVFFISASALRDSQKGGLPNTLPVILEAPVYLIFWLPPNSADVQLYEVDQSTYDAIRAAYCTGTGDNVLKEVWTVLMEDGVIRYLCEK